MDLEKALQLVVDKAIKAASPQVVEIPHETRKKHIVINGERAVVEVPPAVRQHQVRRLEDLMAYTLAEAETQTCVLWRNEREVVLILDDEDRRDRVTLRLERAGLFQTAQSLVGRGFSQDEFIRLLRVELKGAWEVSHPKLLEAVRRLTFESGSTTVSDKRHGRDTLGADVHQAVRSEAEIPEQVHLVLRVYANPGEDFKTGIECCLEIDVHRGRFTLSPLPNELDDALAAAQSDLHERLVAVLGDAAVPIYYGTP